MIIGQNASITSAIAGASIGTKNISASLSSGDGLEAFKSISTVVNRADVAVGGQGTGVEVRLAKISFSSSNPGVATVTHHGDVILTGAGSTVIRVNSSTGANSGATSVTYFLTVKTAPETINLSAELESASAGDGAEQGAQFLSSNPEVATVNERGAVMLVGAGEANISAKTTTDSDPQTSPPRISLSVVTQ